MLDPTLKIAHVQKYWGEELLRDALEHAEEMVQFQYAIILSVTDKLAV